MIKKLVSLVFVLLCFASNLYAQSFTGLEVMEKVFSRDDGNDAQFKIDMILIDKSGNRRERKLEIYSKDFGELVKTYLKFYEPADIDGTSFLTLENADKDDTQYLYLPALGRARRIVSSQKDLLFVNTDFTYEDMQRRKPNEDEHKLLGEEQVEERTCYKIESVPLKKSQYSKRIHSVDKSSFVIVKTDFFNKKNKLSKTFHVERLEKSSGIWTTFNTLIEDLGERHKTLMKITEVNYNQGLDDELFTLRKLEEE